MYTKTLRMVEGFLMQMVYMFFLYILWTIPHSAFTSPLFSVFMQIISSFTPCGDFFFRCCQTSESPQADVASYKTSSSSKSQSSGLTEDRASDITNIVKKCNELDLNIIIIWKVHTTMQIIINFVIKIMILSSLSDTVYNLWYKPWIRHSCFMQSDE